LSRIFSLSSILFFLALTLTPTTVARAQHSYSATPDSRFWVEGTSNKTKNWRAHPETIAVHLFGDLGAMRVDSASVNVGAGALQGEVDHGAFVMNRLIKQALKAGEHPEIVFRLNGFSASGEDTSAFEVSGRLTLAGVAHDISFPCIVEMTGANVFRFTGSYTLAMPDYEIRPPSIRTLGYHVGKSVDIFFDLFLAPSE